MLPSVLLLLDWAASGVVSVDVTPDGLDFAASDNRPHYRALDNRPHHAASDNRPYYRVEE